MLYHKGSPDSVLDLTSVHNLEIFSKRNIDYREGMYVEYNSSTDFIVR